jgi:hypothetical protein
VGTWYILDEMLQFFSVLKKNYPTAKFSFSHSFRYWNDQAKNFSLAFAAEDFIIMEASRKDVRASLKLPISIYPLLNRFIPKFQVPPPSWVKYCQWHSGDR